MQFVWLKRTFEAGGYKWVQQRFGEELLLVWQIVAPLVQTIYIRIPETLIPQYPGFESASETEIPEEANLWLR